LYTSIKYSPALEEISHPNAGDWPGMAIAQILQLLRGFIRQRVKL